jgi:CheY-like chemotaxis protein
VLNLATGGVALVGTSPLPLGAKVEISLPLGLPEPIALAGHILRERPTLNGPSFVVSWDEPTAPVRDLLQRTIDEALANAQIANVLVVDDSREVGHALRLQLWYLGHAAHAVTSPLEAVRVLEVPNRVSVAIVDLVLGTADGLDLLAFLKDRHPYIRRVLLSGHTHPGQLAHLLRRRPEAVPHEVLGKPWSESTLAQAVAG